MSKFVKFEAQIDGYLPELSVKVDNILMVTIDDVYFTQGGKLRGRRTQDWNDYSTWNFECITSQIEELSTDEWIDLSYGSADVKVVSKIESSLEDLAENTTKVAEKVKNLAQVFDTEDKLNG